jgi:hypothetical protein
MPMYIVSRNRDGAYNVLYSTVFSRHQLAQTNKHINEMYMQLPFSLFRFMYHVYQSPCCKTCWHTFGNGDRQCKSKFETPLSSFSHPPLHKDHMKRTLFLSYLDSLYYSRSTCSMLPIPSWWLLKGCSRRRLGKGGQRAPSWEVW